MHQYRGVAQLIERGIWDAEAAGLSPVTPTIKFFLNKGETTMNNTELEMLTITNRITLLKSRKTDNGRVIAKLQRRLRNITNRR